MVPFIENLGMVPRFFGGVSAQERITAPTGTALGDPEKSTTSSVPTLRPITVVLLIICFCIADFCNSVNEEFQRMVVTDISVSKKDCMLGHSLMGALIGLGSGLGYLIGFLHFHAIGSLSGMGVEIFLGLLLFTPAILIHLYLGGPGFRRRAMEYHSLSAVSEEDETIKALLPSYSIAGEEGSTMDAVEPKTNPLGPSAADDLQSYEAADVEVVSTPQPEATPQHSLWQSLRSAKTEFLWLCAQQVRRRGLIHNCKNVMGSECCSYLHGWDFGQFGKSQHHILVNCTEATPMPPRAASRLKISNQE